MNLGLTVGVKELNSRHDHILFFKLELHVNMTRHLAGESCRLFCRQLVNIGVLTTRDVGSWWLSIPGAGAFMKSFSNGNLIRIIIISFLHS